MEQCSVLLPSPSPPFTVYALPLLQASLGAGLRFGRSVVHRRVGEGRAECECSSAAYCCPPLLRPSPSSCLLAV